MRTSFIQGKSNLYATADKDPNRLYMGVFFIALVECGCRQDRLSELTGQNGRKAPHFVERLDRMDEFFAKNTCVLHLLG